MKKLHITFSSIGILILLLAISFDLCGVVYAQQWEYTLYETSFSDAFTGKAVLQCADDGSVILGSGRSGSDRDIVVLKFDNAGDIEWQRAYGGSSYEYPGSIIQTSEGGFLIYGNTNSFGSGSSSLFLLKLDTAGSMQWMKIYSHGGYDGLAETLRETPDNGFIFCSYSNLGGTVDSAMWVIKVHSDGSIHWQKAYGEHIQAPSINTTSDGGYILTGGVFDSPVWLQWIAKLDASGNISWEKEYGQTTLHPSDVDIIQADDGGYVLTGDMYNTVTHDHSSCMAKLSSTGSIEWQKEFIMSGSFNSVPPSIIKTYDGGYLMHHFDDHIIKTDSGGNVEWQKKYYAQFLQKVIPDQTADNGYLLICGDDPIKFYKVDSSCSITDCPGAFGTGTMTEGTLNLPINDSSQPVVTTSVTPIDVTPDVTLLNVTKYEPCEYLSTFAVNCTPDILEIDRGSSKSCECTITSFDWLGDVTLSTTNLPANVTSEFLPVVVSLGKYETVPSTLTLNAQSTQAVGSYQFQVVGTSGSLSTIAGMELSVQWLDIELNPLDFEAFEVGETETNTVTVTNRYSEDVLITDVSSPTSPFSIVDNTCTGETLEGNESCTFGVTFSPTAIAHYEDEIVLTYESGFDDQANTLYLLGDGSDPSITMSLTEPNGGESWDYSSPDLPRRHHVISWEYDYYFDLTRTRISYSTDDGSSYRCIADSDNTNYESSGSVEITDDSVPVISQITVPDSFSILDMNVYLNISHPRVSDLEVRLIGPPPAATEIVLTDHTDVSGANYENTYFNDEAEKTIDSGSAPYRGQFQPEQLLSTFDGSNSAGVWTLQVVDTVSEESGTIDSWRINFSDCHNMNYTGSDILASGSSTFIWEMPTQAEALHRGQKLPTSFGRIKIETWGQGVETAEIISAGSFYIVKPTTTSVLSLILWNSERICSEYDTNPDCDCSKRDRDPDCTVTADLYTSLLTLADHEKVTGVVLDLSEVPAVETACTCWDRMYDGDSGNDYLEPCETADSDPQVRANTVVEAIRSYLHSQITGTYTNAAYIILTGDDFQIPFYRIEDATTIHSEVNYPGESGVSLDTSTTVGSALNGGYYLSDSYYAELSPEPTGLNPPHDFMYLHDLSIGRLVESPSQIQTVIDTYLSYNGQIDFISPDDTALVTGFDFFYDSSCSIYDVLAGAKSADYLLDDPDDDPENTCPDTPYAPSDLENAIFLNSPNRVVNVNTHANHFTLTASSGTPSSLDTTTMAANSNNLEGTIFYTSGCHSGLPVPPVGANTYDLPELMADKQVLGYIGNTGYGWGLRFGSGLTEKLMLGLTDQLVGYDSISVGDMLSKAKRRYVLEERRYDVFDEKVIHQATLFGIPNTLIINAVDNKSEQKKLPAPDGPDWGCADGICLEKQMIGPEKNNSLPDGVIQLNLNFTFGQETYSEHSTTDGVFYKLNEHSSGEVGDAIQPLFTYDSSLSGTIAKGVLFAGGQYQTETSFEPVVAVPRSTNVDKGEGPLPIKSTFSPAVKISSWGCGSATKSTTIDVFTSMIVHTGYFDDTKDIQYLFDNMEIVIYYSNDADSTAPLVSDPGVGGFHTLTGMKADFSVLVSDSSEVFRTLVIYNNLRDDLWQTFDLASNDGGATWTGSLELKSDIVYFIQSVDSAGNVGTLLETGTDKDGEGTAYGSSWAAPKVFDITLTDIDGDGLPDVWESRYPCLAEAGQGDAQSDPDYDYLTNEQEFTFETNPCLGDSDGGGENDGSEYYNGRDYADLIDDKLIIIEPIQESGPDTVTIQWHDSLSSDANSDIDGYYYVYRSDTPIFTPDDLISVDVYGDPDPIPHCTSGAGRPDCTNDDFNDDDHEFVDYCPSSLCYYKVWNYELTTDPPLVDSLVPSSADEMTQTEVIIYGLNFTEGAAVTFCETPATDVVVENESRIRCTTPELTARTCDVTVVNPNGQKGTKTSGFVFTEP